MVRRSRNAANALRYGNRHEQVASVRRLGARAAPMSRRHAGGPTSGASLLASAQTTHRQDNDPLRADAYADLGIAAFAGRT